MTTASQSRLAVSKQSKNKTKKATTSVSKAGSIKKPSSSTTTTLTMAPTFTIRKNSNAARNRTRLHHRQLPTRARLMMNRLKNNGTQEDEQGPILVRGTSILSGIRDTYIKRGSLDGSGARRRRSNETVVLIPDDSTMMMMDEDKDEQGGGGPQVTDTENESTTGSVVKHVHFSKEKLVKEIPHHSTYTEAQRLAMWNSRQAIRKMVRKNQTEYNYEGWRVENCLEEDDFIVVASGARVHPAHVSRERQRQLEAAAVLQELSLSFASR